MGGDLPPAPAEGGGAPRFALWAIQDPGSEGVPGTPLQRIQIVKGWTEEGEPRERVIDVAIGGSDAGVDLAHLVHALTSQSIGGIWSEASPPHRGGR